MTNLDCILESKDITLLIKFPIIKALIFLVVMYRYGSWTIKKRLRAKEFMFLKCGAGKD